MSDENPDILMGDIVKTNLGGELPRSSRVAASSVTHVTEAVSIALVELPKPLSGALLVGHTRKAPCSQEGLARLSTSLRFEMRVIATAAATIPRLASSSAWANRRS